MSSFFYSIHAVKLKRTKIMAQVANLFTDRRGKFQITHEKQGNGKFKSKVDARVSTLNLTHLADGTIISTIACIDFIARKERDSGQINIHNFIAYETMVLGDFSECGNEHRTKSKKTALKHHKALVRTLSKQSPITYKQRGEQNIVVVSRNRSRSQRTCTLPYGYLNTVVKESQLELDEIIEKEASKA